MVVYMLSIPKFLEYNSRKDVKNPSWFRMENQFLESVTGALLSNDDIIVWLYLLSQRSKSKHHVFKVSSPHAALVCKLPESKIEACLKNLHAHEMVELNGKYNGNLQKARNGHVTRTSRGRNEDVTDAGVTLHNITRQDITGHATRDVPDRAEPPAPKKIPQPAVDLGELWNEVAGPGLGKVSPTRFGPRRVEAIRAALAYESALEVWREIFRKVAASDFLTGKISNAKHPTWKASFEWAIKPDNACKVLEGRYENQQQAQPKNYITLDDLTGDAS